MDDLQLAFRVAARHQSSYRRLFEKIDAMPATHLYGGTTDYIDITEFFHHPPQGSIFGFRRKSDLKKAVETRIPARDIWPSQSYLIRDGLKRYVLHAPSELPLVVRDVASGKYHAQDHTRIAAQMLRGATMVAVRLIEYTGNRNDPYRRPVAG